MSTALTISPQAPSLTVRSADAERARGYANAEKAVATRRAYGADFSIFRAWCEERQLVVIPASPPTVAAFLAHEASRNVKASTIGRRAAAIRYAHRLAGRDSPTDDERVKATVRGIRRTLGTARSKKAPATAERLLAMAANTGAGLKGLRDRALLLLGFAGANCSRWVYALRSIARRWR
jgi:site-specific recombinase XerD